MLFSDSLVIFKSIGIICKVIWRLKIFLQPFKCSRCLKNNVKLRRQNNDVNFDRLWRRFDVMSLIQVLSRHASYADFILELEEDRIALE